ncbi:MAG: SDR family NAD(P)-dependent oxidoreductase [Lachnospiraceae bacterium]|nr:SDR family NAD(P)-dependent oxidoreductase [Lachnospiraceae bacterium]
MTERQKQQNTVSRSVRRWISGNTASLEGKTAAVTGSTGSIGTALCGYLASLGASLILVDRNRGKSEAFRDRLRAEYGVQAECLTADMSDAAGVKEAAEALEKRPVDFLVLNAGAYRIPREETAFGTENVFQINFLSPYFLARTLLPSLRARKGRVVAVGSLAHLFAKTDPADPDFRNVRNGGKVYGNSKRYLMWALMDLFAGEKDASLAVSHPGISYTNLLSNYPPLLDALVRYPMKALFLRPEKACLPILRGFFEATEADEWIGPRVFSIWGLPAKKALHSVKEEERAQICRTAEEMYRKMRAYGAHG